MAEDLTVVARSYRVPAFYEFDLAFLGLSDLHLQDRIDERCARSGISGPKVDICAAPSASSSSGASGPLAVVGIMLTEATATVKTLVRAMGYSASDSGREDATADSLLIQQHLTAEASGSITTRSALDDKEILVNARHGYGELSALGHAPPASYRLERETGDLAVTASPRAAITLGRAGIAHRSTRANRSFPLLPQEVANLCRVGQAIDETLGIQNGSEIDFVLAPRRELYITSVHRS